MSSADGSKDLSAFRTRLWFTLALWLYLPLPSLARAEVTADSKAPAIASSPFDTSPCTPHPVDVCAAPMPAVTLQRLIRQETEALSVTAEDGYLDVLFRKPGVSFNVFDKPLLCCDIQAFLNPVAPGVWAQRFYVPELDEAVLGLLIVNDGSKVHHPLTFVGAHADHRPLDYDAPKRPIEEVAIESNALRQRRSIFIYRGHACQDASSACRIVYLADGESFKSYVDNTPASAEPILDHLVIVGLAGPADTSLANDTRGDELLLGHHMPAASAFETFFIQEVMPRVEQGRRGRVVRTVGGWSDGGSWAINMALRHPGVFQDVLAFSSGGWVAPAALEDPEGTTFWLGAGKLEGVFYRHTQKYAASLKTLRARVRQRYFVGGHGEATWNALFWWAIVAEDARRASGAGRTIT